MEEAEAKICPNCKREIPSVNFTIHTVHCARNIKVCPVCKEPVPFNELDEHHAKLHKLLPCKQCGESVCGTDLEDHIRDSCGHTIKSCRYCELELPRHELPAHEGYCGVRTEQCPDCREWVMIKYRQLHLDSNHGFLRLDDDPVPQPKKVIPKANINPIRDMLASTYNGPRPANGLRNNADGPRTEARIANGSSLLSGLRNTADGPRTDARVASGVNVLSGLRNNADNPRTDARVVNGSNLLSGLRNTADGSRVRETSVNQFGVGNGAGLDRLTNTSSASRSASDANGHGDQAGGSGEVRKTLLKRTNDQPQVNNAAAAANKLHKDASTSRGAVKKRPAPKPPANRKRDLQYYSALQRQQADERQRQELNAYNAAIGLPPVLSPAEKLDKLRKMDALQNRETDNQDYKNKLQGRVWMNAHDPALAGHRLGDTEESNVRNSLKNLKPMTPAEFMARFEQLRVSDDRPATNGDRFSEIKSSLRELRRGLNEVTAPYNSSSTNSYNDRPRHRSRSSSPDGVEDPSGLEVKLPCEFCAAPVPAHDLVRHQTGCRPDLAQFRPRSPSPRLPPRAASPPPPAPYEQPVIPCEFCTESLPVYLITEHQERCRRDPDLLFPD